MDDPVHELHDHPVPKRRHGTRRIKVDAHQRHTRAVSLRRFGRPTLAAGHPVSRRVAKDKPSAG